MGKVGVQFLEAPLGVAHIVEHLGDDVPPALALARLAGAQVVLAVALLLAAEGSGEAAAHLPEAQAAAGAPARRGVGVSGGRVGVDQGADGVEKDGAHAGGDSTHEALAFGKAAESRVRSAAPPQSI